MSVTIRITSGSDEPFSVDIGKFPTVISLPQSRPEPLLLFFPVFLAVALFVAFDTVTAIVGGGLVAVVIGFALWRRRRHDLVRFEKDRVVVTERRFGRDLVWEAPYREFDGVNLRRRQARSGKTQTVYHIIELKHPDEQKTLPLFVEKTGKKPEQRWRDYADLFGLPPIRERV